MTRDNLSPWWMVTLCRCAVVLLLCSFAFCSTALSADQTSEIHANRPVVPTGPKASDVDVPKGPAAPLAPARAPLAGEPATTPEEMDERMRDLARRMATVEAAGKSSDSKRATAKLAPLSEAEHAAADENATASNQQRLTAPSDARPLGARRQAVVTEPATTQSNSSSVLTVLMALGFVIGLIFLLRAGMRKMLGTSAAVSSSSVVQVLTRVAVAPRNHVVLLRVGGRILVVSDSPSGMRTLSQIDAPEEVADILTAVSSAKSNSVTAGFGQMLTSLGSSYEPQATAAEAGTDENEFRIDRARDNVSGLLGKLRNLTGKGGA